MQTCNETFITFIVQHASKLAGCSCSYTGNIQSVYYKASKVKQTVQVIHSCYMHLGRINMQYAGKPAQYKKELTYVNTNYLTTLNAKM